LTFENNYKLLSSIIESSSVLSDPEYQKYIEQFKFFPSPDLGFVTDIGEQVPALSA